MSDNSKIKVLVALSGGVDSAVAAALLLQQGYAVTAAYMVNYEGKLRNGEECWVPEYQDAARVAATLSIPLLKFDFTKEYKQSVLDYMFAEYEAGRTPNPDVLCNKYVKFGSWLEKARELGFDYLATGHYAIVSPQSSVLSPQLVVKLLQAKDDNKDQTYFLHQLSQDQLRHALFPIGIYTKPEVRELARTFHLPVAQKEESMGICFVGEVPMKDFLKTKIKTSAGNIVTSDGGIIGQHEGLPFYTIGQRSGLAISHHPDQDDGDKKDGLVQKDTRPFYIISKNYAANELVVDYEDSPLLYKKEIKVSEINWISGQNLELPLECEVRLRHRQPLQQCMVKKMQGLHGILVVCHDQQRAPTPGQFAVFYKDGECLGGGVIQ